MKQIILSLIAICSAFVAQAQSCVSVKQISTNYATKQITFDLKWGTCNNTNHLYRVWVFVDYRPVTNVMKGAWGRTAITATDKGTLVSVNKGVWVTGSANATQRVTLTLDVVGNKFDWCAFAIDYPPQATFNNGTYTLKGTPPFTVNGVQLGDTQKTYTGNITAITDATGNPDGFFDVAYWTTCSGFSYISNVAYENNIMMDWYTANTYCQNKGMRLPTITEVQCMCSNRGSLPSGYVNGCHYSSTPRSSGCYYNVDFGNCITYCSLPIYAGYIKCVK